MPAKSPTAKSRRKRGSNTWKDIDQSVKPKSRSTAAERRIWVGRLKMASGVIAVAAVVVGALHFVPKLEGGPELLTKAGESVPIRTIDIQTDGNLSEAFVLERLAVEEDANLLSVDLDELKERLESIGQVEHAVVSRRFPDTLEVTIVECHPIARIRALRSNGEELLLFADGRGQVFEADMIDEKIEKSLPFLHGVSLRKEGSGYSQIEGMESLKDLLDETVSIAPHLYRFLRSISLSHDDRLVAKGRYIEEIVFDRSGDFRSQLGKLDYIIDYYRSLRRGPIKRIDLTLGDQVPVQDL